MAQLLKKLTPKHKRIIRDLAVGRDRKAIGKDLNISTDRISHLENHEPLFKGALVELQKQIEDRVINSEVRISTMEMLEEIAQDAAVLCHSVINGDEPSASIDLRIKTAWDCLDRTDNKATPVQKDGPNNGVIVNVADMIVAAYKGKYDKEKLPVKEPDVQISATSSADIIEL